MTSAVADLSNLREWLPIELMGRPDGVFVRWLYFGSEVLTEPFFSQTVARLRRALPSHASRVTSLEVLAHIRSEVPLSGFIFHVSRCGSTLLANALRAVPGAVVVSEAEPIGAVLATIRPDTERNRPHEVRNALEAIMRPFRQRRCGNESGVILKFSSWSLLLLDVCRRVFPDVPCVVVVRDPIEVIVSCLRRPTPWMRWRTDTAALTWLSSWQNASVDTATEAQFCARVIGLFCEAAKRHVGPECRIIDYQSLNVDRTLDVAAMFGFDTIGVSRTRMEQCFVTYSKSVDRKAVFVDDRASKQAFASGAVRLASRQWADNEYAALKSLALWP